MRKGKKMRNKKANGLLPGWPPFTEFKRDMLELLNEAQQPIKTEIQTIKHSLINHINKTDSLSKKTDSLSKKTDSLSKKTDFLKNKVSEINAKLDKVLEL